MMLIPLLALAGVLIALIWDDERTDAAARREDWVRIDRDLSTAAETITIRFMDSREERLFNFDRPFDSSARAVLRADLGLWCDENLTDRIIVLKDIERQCTHLAFQNERDAFLFKMTWL